MAEPLTARGREIVAAARELLDEHGIDALTMRRLAARLGIRAPSLYKHLPDKAAVEAAVIATGLQDLAAALEEARHAAADPMTALAAAYRTFALTHPHLYLLMTNRPPPREHLPVGVEHRAAAPVLQAVENLPRQSILGLRPRHGGARARRPLPTGRGPRHRMASRRRCLPTTRRSTRRGFDGLTRIRRSSTRTSPTPAIRLSMLIWRPGDFDGVDVGPWKLLSGGHHRAAISHPPRRRRPESVCCHRLDRAPVLATENCSRLGRTNRAPAGASALVCGDRMLLVDGQPLGPAVLLGVDGSVLGQNPPPRSRCVRPGDRCCGSLRRAHR